MAYPDDNKVTEEGLIVKYTYTSKIVYIGEEEGTQVYAPLYCVTRTATKRYKYVGLSETQAKALAASKQTQYTRSRPGGFEYGEQSIEYKTPVQYMGAEIAIRHFAAHLWEVVINVNENEQIWTFTLGTSLAGLFSSYISGRTYDE